MKTRDLITAIAADAESVERPIGATVLLALASGAVAASALFLWQIGWRPDIAAAAETWRFLLKFVVTVALFVPALFAVVRLSRPDGRLGSLAWGLAIGPLIAAGGVAAEMALTPAAAWPAEAIGTNWRVCLTVIPILSVMPLAALVYALKRGAPSRGGLAGALAGLAAGALAATLYAAHCNNDSPMFVALWYSLAIAGVTAAGAVIGSRLLRW